MCKKLLCLSFCSLPALQAQVAGPVIRTLAGADWTFQADGKPAVSASIGQASGVAVDAAGNVYIADVLNFQVYRVSADGMIRVLGGNGFDATQPNGPNARNLPVNRPTAVAVAADGSVYFTESYSIRKIAPDGSLSSVVGYSTDVFGDGGPALQAGVGIPRGLAFDRAGNLYITASNRIRKIDANGIITTIAGNGQPGFSGDNGPAAGATLNTPIGIRADAAGNVYFADANNGTILSISASEKRSAVLDVWLAHL